jgi:hypothetical protein
LGEQYGAQFSFSDNLLSGCLISDSSTYSSAEKAIENLVKRCQFDYNVVGKVYLITKRMAVEPPKINKFFRGKIVDAVDGESLPFTTIYLDAAGTTTDAAGDFQYKSPNETVRLQASHVGYLPLDTILSAATKHRVLLKRSLVALQEIEIIGEQLPAQTSFNTAPAAIKLNHHTTTFLPGSSDNTVFNLLRLQPGVLASGEQTKDFFIWGSYKGQSHVIFDGITLFHLGGINDQIGVINPLIVKDIELFKAGYNVHIGDRTGGVVNITGTNGQRDRFHTKLKLNNQTLAGLVSAPIGKRAALQGGFRKTFYKLYQSGSFSSFYESVPYHDFNDVNLKYSGNTENGDEYYVSFLRVQDDGKFELGDESDGKVLFTTSTISNAQHGLSVFYNRKWKRAGATQFRVSNSRAESNLVNYWSYELPSDSSKSSQSELSTNNGVSESKIKVEHSFTSTNKHSLKVGAHFIQNTTSYRQDTGAISIKRTADQIDRIGAYVTDDLRLGKSVRLQPGLRVDYQWESAKSHLQPRIALLIKPLERWHVRLASGVYNQFVQQVAYVDAVGNQFHYWSLNGQGSLNSTQSKHHVASVFWSAPTLSVTVDGFYKTYANLSRWGIDPTALTSAIYADGLGRSYGLDFQVQKRLKKHEFRLAYTCAKTEEWFTNFETDQYRLAPHDQRHELKATALLNFKPFYLSINHVYGSGLQPQNPTGSGDITPYNRLDAALFYKRHGNRVELETGLSIVNVLNIENVRYDNFSSFPDENVLYQTGIPFMPTVFLHLIW